MAAAVFYPDIAVADGTISLEFGEYLICAGVQQLYCQRLSKMLQAEITGYPSSQPATY
jgi:hypothetical protein